MDIPYQLRDDDEDLPEANTKEKAGKPSFSLGRLMSQAGPEMCILSIATVALFLSAIFNLAVPAIVGTVIDAISIKDLDNSTNLSQLTGVILELDLGHTQQEVLTVAIVALSISIGVGALFSFIRGYLFNLAGERVVARLRKQLFEAIVRQEIAFFDVNRTGELTNRLAADTTVLKDACTTNISMGLRWAATIIGGLVYLFVISYQLAFVMLSVIPLVAISARCYGMKIRAVSKRTQDALASATQTANESFSNIRDVRAFSREEYQEGLYDEKIEETYTLGATMALYYGIFIAMMGIFGSGSMVLVLWYGSVLVIRGAMSAGDLTSFVLYTITVGAALAGFSGLFGSLMQAVGANERVFQLIDRVPLINTSGGKRLETLQGRVQLVDVSFSYPSRSDVEVLKNVTLDLKPGTVTALVGASGGGKTTVVSLVERFYDLGAHGGQVLVDGRDVRELDPVWLHRQIGLVKQEPVLFATSIRENLRYGVGECTDEEMVQAANVANAHDFITQFPEGYDTAVGERGVRLSGGQKQRVAIARAVLMNPAILIADEATSALDAESEHHVQAALDTLMQGRTVLLIAHRLSTVKNADNVVCMEGGRVVEQGTHEELLALNGSYTRLVKRQLTNDEED